MATQYDDMAGEEMDAAQHPDNSHSYKVAGDIIPHDFVSSDTSGPSARNETEQTYRVRNSDSSKLIGGVDRAGAHYAPLNGETPRFKSRGGSSGGKFMPYQ